MSFPAGKSSGSGSLEHARQALFHRNLHVMKLDLEPMQALSGLLGQPQASLLCVHVAGTNGKGSVFSIHPLWSQGTATLQVGTPGSGMLEGFSPLKPFRC